MIIGIDASRYGSENPTGVELYSRVLIDHLLSIAKKQTKHSVWLYTPRFLPGLPRAHQKVIPGQRLWTQRHLSREMRNHPPDVLFVPSHVLPLLHPKKSVVTIHDVAFLQFPQAYSPFQWFYLNWSTRFALKHATRLIVPSEATRADLIHYYSCNPSKIVVIPHGFLAPTLRLSNAQMRTILKRFHLKPTDRYVFFVGRLETKKNLANLLDAFVLFQKHHPGWKLILGGQRGVGFSNLLKKLKKNPEAFQDVLMPGYLTEKEKFALFRHASIFAFPSFAEGFGFPILEAAHHDVPILASRIPALLEFKEEVDVFVDPHDAHSIAAGLIQLASNPPQKSSSRAKYSWKRNAKEVWNLLTHSA